MTMTSYKSALQLSADIKAKKISVKEVLDMYFDKAEKSQNFVTLANKEQAYARADAVQNAINTDFPYLLAGIPIGLKDNISVAGLECACGSKMLEGYKPVFNATIVDRLEAAGMIVLGKLKMDEFGNECACAAAVAAGEIPIALGTHANDISVTSIKPAYGELPLYGVISHASSLERLGSIGWDVEDCKALLSIISDTKVMLPEIKDMQKNIQENMLKDTLINPQIEEIHKEMPMADYILPAHYIISCAETSSNLARYDGLQYGYRANADNLDDLYKNTRNEGFGLELKKRILFGTLVLSSDYYDSYYKKALQIRSLIRDEYSKQFITSSANDISAALADLCGLPAITLPMGIRHIGCGV